MGNLDSIVTIGLFVLFSFLERFIIFIYMFHFLCTNMHDIIL